jgi:hypothetical protein
MGYFSSSGSWMCSGVARSSALLIDRSSQDQRGAPIVAGEDLLLDSAKAWMKIIRSSSIPTISLEGADRALEFTGSDEL